MITNITSSLRFAALVLSCTALTTCGGGGGGGGNDVFIGAANVQVQLSPSTIDTGDRSLVTIQVSDVHENGILLKVHYPKSLAYVPDSAFLTYEENVVDIGPDKNVTKASDTYLVFFLSQDDFGSSNEGTVTFQLVGNSALESGEVQVDADVNDSLVDDASEFNVDTPEFGAEDAAEIEVTN